MNHNEEEKLEKLRKITSEKSSMVVAFSGSVDSSLIAKVAKGIGLPLKILKLSELDNSGKVK